MEAARAEERYRGAMRELGALGAPVDRFFTDVLVMADDPALRDARLTLLSVLRRTILAIADIAEVAPEERQVWMSRCHVHRLINAARSPVTSHRY